MKRIIASILLTLALLPATAQENVNPVANADAVVNCGKARFTVLTPEMIRIQYSDKQLFCNDTVYFLSTPCKELVALLNSRLGWRLFAAHCPRIQNGYSLNWINLQQIPVPLHLPTELATYADRLAELQGRDAYNALYEELNTYINNLYGITEAEL